MTARRLLLLILLALTVAAPLWAAEQQDTTMDDVVVTASRSAEQRRCISANITTIDSAELRSSTSRSVGEVLAEKGLGHIHAYPGALTSIGIRGFRTDSHGNDLLGHVLILLDGRRAGSGNATKFLTKNVERIEIIRGPGAVQYGSSGMGGVVNIITRKGDKNSLFVAGGVGSFNASEGSIGGTANLDGVDFAGAFTRRSRDAYNSGDDKRYNNTDLDEQTAVSAQLGYTFATNQRVGIIYTSSEVEDAGSPSYFSEIDYDDTTDKDNWSIDFKYTGSSAAGRVNWMARYFFGKDKNLWRDPPASDPSAWGFDDGIPSKNETEQKGAQAQVSATFATTTITVGFDWLDYEVKNTWTPEKSTYENPALFLLGRTSLLDERLTISYGLRYDWYAVEMKNPKGRDEDQSNATPQIGVAFMLNDHLKLRAQYAEGFMMPAADQLAADYYNWGSHYVGNDDLDPESSKTWEGGIDYSANALNVSLTYFYTDFEDKIVSSRLANGDRSWDNSGDATISGFETALSYDIGLALKLAWEIRPYFSATFLDEYDDDKTHADLMYVSQTTYSAGIGVGDGDGFACRFNVAYASSQDVQDWESAYGAHTTLPHSTVADLFASYRLLHSDKGGDLTVRGEIRNLFDEDYAYVKGYPMPGRSFFVGMRWDY